MSLAAAALDLLHRHPGRKRLQRARRPDGKADGETPDQARAVARAYRIKFGARPEAALDANYSTTIGQLLIEGSISQKQFLAAQIYHRCIISYWRVMGVPSPHPRTSDLLIAIRGHSVRPDLDTEEINRIKGAFRDCRRALLDCGRDLLVGSAINRVVYNVVIEDRPRWCLSSDEVQNLRGGLNALARVFR